MFQVTKDLDLECSLLHGIRVFAVQAFPALYPNDNSRKLKKERHVSP